jgi:hypothetical protein
VLNQLVRPPDPCSCPKLQNPKVRHPVPFASCTQEQPGNA